MKDVYDQDFIEMPTKDKSIVKKKQKKNTSSNFLSHSDRRVAHHINLTTDGDTNLRANSPHFAPKSESPRDRTRVNNLLKDAARKDVVIKKLIICGYKKIMNILAHEESHLSYNDFLNYFLRMSEHFYILMKKIFDTNIDNWIGKENAKENRFSYFIYSYHDSAACIIAENRSNFLLNLDRHCRKGVDPLSMREKFKELSINEEYLRFKFSVSGERGSPIFYLLWPIIFAYFDDAIDRRKNLESCCVDERNSLVNRKYLFSDISRDYVLREIDRAINDLSYISFLIARIHRRYELSGCFFYFINIFTCFLAWLDSGRKIKRDFLSNMRDGILKCSNKIEVIKLLDDCILSPEIKKHRNVISGIFSRSTRTEQNLVALRWRINASCEMANEDSDLVDLNSITPALIMAQSYERSSSFEV